jgi:hypothetical protein
MQHFWRVLCAALWAKERESVVLPYFPKNDSGVIERELSWSRGGVFNKNLSGAVAFKIAAELIMRGEGETSGITYPIWAVDSAEEG